MAGAIISGSLAGQTLTEGVFHVNGVAFLSTTAPLTLSGDTSSIFIINISDSLHMIAGGQILLDGVLAENIYWNVNGGLKIDSGAVVYGVMMASNIYKYGKHFGLVCLLSQGMVNLEDLSEIEGHNNFSAPLFMQSSINSQIDCFVVHPTCPLNVVLNGDFETRIPNYCPDLRGNMGSGGGSVGVCDWIDIGPGTCDYYHTCSNNLQTSVPVNQFHSFLPSLPSIINNPGQAYVSIVAGSGTREYFGQRLINNLEADEWYYGEFFVTRANLTRLGVDNLGMHVSPILTPANSTIGAAFIREIIPGTNTIVDINPSIEINTPGVVINPNGWMRVNGIFKANGTERQITIGRFKETIILQASTIIGPSFPQYYFDNVSLSKLPDAGPDKVLCAGGPGIVLGETITCGLPQGLTTTFAWAPTAGLNNPNILNPTATPSATTTYTLTATIQGLAPYTTTVTVTVPNPLQISPTGPIAVCPNGSVTLTATGGGNTYSWSNSVVGGYNIIPSTTPYQAGVATTRTFTVTSTVGGCTMQATKEVTVLPAPVVLITSSLGTSNTFSNPICAGTPVTLSASGASTYTWTGGVIGNPIIVNPTTTPSQTYGVTGKDANGCSGSRTQTIFVKPNPNNFSITSNSPICQGQNASLAVTPVQTGVTYVWSPGGGTGSSITTGPINNNTTYTATATLNGCNLSNMASIAITTAPNLQVNPAICNSNGTLSFTASGASTYTWIPSGGAAPGPASITSSGTYTTPLGSTATSLIVASSNSCGASNVNIVANASCCRNYEVYPGGYEDQTNPSGETAVIVLDGGNPGWPDYHLIDAGGGTVYFDGVYKVTCPLKLINGEFIFNPGTEMYFDATNFNTSATVCSDFGLQDFYNFIQFGEEYGDEVIVEMNDARFAAACGEMWGGMYAMSNVMVTSNSSTIRDAYIGMAFHNECLAEPNTAYYIDDTDFTDNLIGVWDHNRLEAPTFPNPVYITNSRFTAQYPIPCPYPNYDYASTGIYFGLSYPYDAIDYSAATFSNNYFYGMRDYGMAGSANKIVIGPQNYFDNIGYASIAVDGGGTHGHVIIKENEIYVSADWLNNGISTNNPNVVPDIVTGIEANFETIIQDNYIEGIGTLVYAGSGNAAVPSMIGVYNWESPVRTIVQTNIFLNLNEGVSTEYANPYGLAISDNLFTDVLNGVYLRGANSTSFRPGITCNSFERANASDPIVGIGTDLNAHLSDLYKNVAGYHAGNGNNFITLDVGQGDEGVENWGPSSGIFEYTGFDNTTEENLDALFGGIGPFGSGGMYMADPLGWNANTCSGAYGVNRVMGTGPAAIQEMMDSVTANVGSEDDIRYYLDMITEYHLADSARVQILESYTASLAGFNQLAHNNLRIALMNHHRSLRNETQAQAHRAALQGNNPFDNNLQNYCLYFEVTGRMGTSGRMLYKPDSADVAELQQVALSGTGIAFKACRLLQFYDRGAPCYVSDTLAIFARKGRFNTPKTDGLLGQSYPNPTTSLATIPYKLPKGVHTATMELHELVTGRSIGRYNLPIAEGPAELAISLNNLPGGFYIYTIVIDGRPAGTKKMVLTR